MTKEMMRVEIAKALGWKLNRDDDGCWLLYNPKNEYVSCDWGQETTLARFGHKLPNWPDDLNACHEMESHLSDEDWSEYHRRLWLIARPDKSIPETGCNDHTRRFIHATSEQKSICFVKTLSCWKG